MAITFTKQPTGIYPAYNDSFVQFTSDLAGGERAEIVLTPASTFPNPFVIYPNSSGVYTFNFKDIVKVLLNENGFEDPSPDYPAGFAKNFNHGFISINPTITVYNSGGGSDSTSPTYDFIRGVKQIGEVVHNNEAQILNYSDNGIDYFVSYWEGFPFTFELQRIPNLDFVMITNLNTGDDSTVVQCTETGSFRFYVDKVGDNWTASNFLPLPDVMNRLEIYSDGLNPPTTFRTNLTIHKHAPERCGVYLKWYNDDGGYSYYLFDEFYKTSIRNRSVGNVGRNQFLNVGDGLKNPVRSLGKEAGETWRLKTKVDREEAKLLRSLFTSPSVQLWSSIDPYIDGEWIDVQVSDTYSIASKKKLNEVTVNVQLPDLITAGL